jgi:hypothetical protein
VSSRRSPSTVDYAVHRLSMLSGLAEREILQRHSLQRQPRCVSPPPPPGSSTPMSPLHHDIPGERVPHSHVPDLSAQSITALETPPLVTINAVHSDLIASASSEAGEASLLAADEQHQDWASEVAATDLTLSEDEGGGCTTIAGITVVASDVRAHVVRYNKPVRLLTVINDNTVECLACTRAQRHQNPFRIDRNPRRPGAFLQAIDQHCSSTAEDGRPGTHARNVESFRAYLKSQLQISFGPAPASGPDSEPNSILVKCRGYMPHRLSTTVKLLDSDTVHTVDLNPRIFLDDLSISKTLSTGAIVWYADPGADAYRHRYGILAPHRLSKCNYEEYPFSVHDEGV